MDLDPKAAALAILCGIVIAVIVYFIISAVANFLVMGLCIVVVAIAAALIYKGIKK